MLGDGPLKRIRKQPFIAELPRRPRCMNGAKNPGGEARWASWFELPAPHLDEITPGEYTRIRMVPNTPKYRISRKPSSFSCREV